MRYAFLVAWREFVENAKTKGFWISIFLVPVMLFVSVMVPALLAAKATPTRHYVLVDKSGMLAAAVDAKLEQEHQQRILEALKEYARNYAAPAETNSQRLPANVETFMSNGGLEKYLDAMKPRLKPGAPPFKEPRRLFQPVPLPEGLTTNADLAALTQELKPYLRGEKDIQVNGAPEHLAAAVLIPPDIEQRIVRPGGNSPSGTNTGSGIEYWSANIADSSLHDEVESAVNTEIRRREYLKQGLDSAAVKRIELTHAPFDSKDPRKEAGKEAVSGADVVRQWAPSGFVYLLWIAVFSISQMLLNNIIEEKSNRIIEVLLSSVTPGELMMGKLFGIAAVGLVMVSAWILSLFGILIWKSGEATEFSGQLFTALKTSNMVPMFAIYFILGYLMYAAFILSLGSVCNTIKEAQNYMGMITVILMVPLLMMTYLPKDPNGVLARVMSWIPIYTPFTMMNRVNADPPAIDLIGTLVLLVITTAGALWMAGRIFRTGILRTGQPPKLLEMLRWIKN
jgi:ABC-2 type transport system permease protein